MGFGEADCINTEIMGAFAWRLEIEGRPPQKAKCIEDKKER
jgi:hypothetical protein